MPLPFFFVEQLEEKQIVLKEDTSKHMINVLRMGKGEEVMLTDGRGKKALASIVDDNRKKCTVELNSIQTEERKQTITIGMSLIKNASRFEWFLEKATEIGVTEIVPMICDRTEKEKFRFDRMQSILVSAMLQSQQSWLPVLHEPGEFGKIITNSVHQNKFIAHCLPQEKRPLKSILNSPPGSNPVAVGSQTSSSTTIMLIGPEGDFSAQEIFLAREAGFQAVALGNTRLRTETAGIVAAVLLCIS